MPTYEQFFNEYEIKQCIHRFIYRLGLHAEIQAAYKEGDCVKMKLRLQEESLDSLRAKMSDAEDDHNAKYSEQSTPTHNPFRFINWSISFFYQFISDDLEARHTELQERFAQMQKLAIALQVQLAEAQCDAADLRAEKERMIKERDEEKQGLQDALDAAIIDRAEIEARWQRDFEQLRTVNSGKSTFSERA